MGGFQTRYLPLNFFAFREKPSNPYFYNLFGYSES